MKTTKTKTTRRFRVMEGGTEERKGQLAELSAQFKARFPNARLDFFGAAEVAEVLEYAKEVSPETFKRYIEQKMTQALKDLEEATALKLEKWRGLL